MAKRKDSQAYLEGVNNVLVKTHESFSDHVGKERTVIEKNKVKTLVDSKLAIDCRRNNEYVYLGERESEFGRQNIYMGKMRVAR